MAAWTATDSFDSYPTGSLIGQNGGTGFSAAWAGANGTVVSSPVNSGTRSVHVLNFTTFADFTRSLTTGVTSGIFRVYMLTQNAPATTQGIYPMLFRDATVLKFWIGWGVTGMTGNNIGFGDGTTFQTVIVGPSTNTWYFIDVQFDQANNRARASGGLAGGAAGPWSSYVTATGGSFTSIDSVRVTTGDSPTSDTGFYIDDIGVGTGPTAATGGSLLLMGSGT